MPPGHQGEPTPSAYHTSPTQAGQPYHHHSPNTPAPLPLQPHQHHRQPASPSSTELPPISTALYSRDTSRYYDPTSDNGDHRVARDPARYDPQYPAQVRISITLHRVNSPSPSLSASLPLCLSLFYYLPACLCFISPLQGYTPNSDRAAAPGPSRLPRPSTRPQPLREGLSLARRRFISPALALAAAPFTAPAHRRHGDHVTLSRLAISLSIHEPAGRCRPAADLR